MSNRFIKSSVQDKDNVVESTINYNVIFDDKTGEIYYHDENKIWALTKDGHRYEANGIKYEYINGTIEAQSSKTITIIRAVADNELFVNYMAEDGTISKLFVRIILGTLHDHIFNSCLLLLSDNNFYVASNLSKVTYAQRINGQEIHNRLRVLEQKSDKVGDLSSLLTKNKKSVAAAINEIYSICSTSRNLVGYVEYVSGTNSKSINYLDMDIRFCIDNGKWQYYSDALSEWINLPNHWQKLKAIFRTLADAQAAVHEDKEIFGVLETEQVFIVINNIAQLYNLEPDRVGDEYIAKKIIQKDGSIYSGSIILTGMGWTYLINYNQK